jgi:hypothetical protein
MASRFLPGVFAAIFFFAFDFLLAAVATPLLGMDFLAKFDLSIIPFKTAGPARGLRPHSHQASTNSFISPWTPKTTAAVAALPPQVQQLLKEFPSQLRTNAAPPKPLYGVALPPFSPAPGSWTRKNTASLRRNFSPWKKQV